MYYNYHAQIKKLIFEQKLTRAVLVKKWNAISPALVLYFSDHAPMPVREARFSEYFPLLKSMGISIESEL